MEKELMGDLFKINKTVYNPLIAVFMGGEIEAENQDGTFILFRKPNWKLHGQMVEVEELKYDESYEWLMPVVDKVLTYRLAYPDQTDRIGNMKIFVKFEVLYEAVVDFIKWLNANEKQ